MVALAQEADKFCYLRGEVQYSSTGRGRLIIVSVAHKCQVKLKVGVVSMQLFTPRLDFFLDLINPWPHRPSAVNHETNTDLHKQYIIF